MVPFFLSIAIPFVGALVINWKIILITPLVLVILKLTVSNDDFYFRIWWIGRMTKSPDPEDKTIQVYSPIRFKSVDYERNLNNPRKQQGYICQK